MSPRAPTRQRNSRQVAAAASQRMSAPGLSAAQRAARDHAALAAALDPIITIDAAGAILSASDSIEGVLGWKPVELIGRNVSILMPEPHRSAHDDYLRRYARTGRTSIMGQPRELDAVRRDGVLVPVELCVSRADVPGEAAPLFVGIVRDITLRKRTEQELARHRADLEKLVEARTAELHRSIQQANVTERMAAIGTLAAGLGHDMNNVLLPVRAHLNAALAAAAPARDRRVRRCVRQVRKSVDYLQQLADGLHFLAADPERDNGGGPREGTNLAKWWSQTGALLCKPVPAHVRVVASLSRAAPGRAASARLPEVAIAPHRLTQAVLNLVVNAGQAIPPPNPPSRRQGLVRIFATVARKARARNGRDPSGPDMVRLCVQDTGTGMTDEVKRQAFDMFFTTKSRRLGTGLGLPLVARVVKNAGGSVRIESAVGRGTTVILELPAVQGRAKGPPELAARTAVVSVGDPRAASLVRQMLEAAGVHVAIGSDATDADIWVVAPGIVRPAEARAWLGRRSRTTRPRSASIARKLIVFGRPMAGQSAMWSRLAPTIIEHPDDFVSIRDTIDVAVRQG